ncbi:hypothetical protein [Rickettsia endosymbiont of Polydrusus tereticollis]|uniref:hypothetical protein n=1 Tax=Rickettsia endosymbiont of Polydrusus tereticollis TaxID=3066251 RepID=UPI003132D138
MKITVDVKEANDNSPMNVDHIPNQQPNKRKSSEHRSSSKKLKTSNLNISNLSDEQTKIIKDLVQSFNFDNSNISIEEIPNYGESAR